MNNKLTADIVAEAFRAGMLAGFLTSCEGWNGERLDVPEGTDIGEETQNHIDGCFPGYFKAYLSGAVFIDAPGGPPVATPKHPTTGSFDGAGHFT